MSKKTSYTKLLKEAISEWDTSKTVEVKGPMLDPILSYKGDGELPTNKDAAGILERYYFKEEREQDLIEQYETDEGPVSDGPAMQHTEGPSGEEQAGTSDADKIEASKDEKEKDIVKEQEEEDDDEEKEEVSEQEEKKEDEEDKEEVEMESAIIEKLIAEMEGEEEEDKEKEEVSEQEEMDDEDKEEEMTEQEDLGDGYDEGDDFYGGDVEDAIEEWLKISEEEETPSMKHTEGPSGEEQAGTGDAAKDIPDREDEHEDFVEPPKNLKEEVKRIVRSIIEQEMEDEDEEEKEELDVDKEIKEQGSGAGHVPPPSLQNKMKTGDQGEEYDEVEEMFRLFEQMEDEEPEDDEEKKEKLERVNLSKVRV